MAELNELFPQVGVETKPMVQFPNFQGLAEALMRQPNKPEIDTTINIAAFEQALISKADDLVRPGMQDTASTAPWFNGDAEGAGTPGTYHSFSEDFQQAAEELTSNLSEDELGQVSEIIAKVYNSYFDKLNNRFNEVGNGVISQKGMQTLYQMIELGQFDKAQALREDLAANRRISTAVDQEVMSRIEVTRDTELINDLVAQTMIGVASVGVEEMNQEIVAKNAELSANGAPEWELIPLKEPWEYYNENKIEMEFAIREYFDKSYEGSGRYYHDDGALTDEITGKKYDINPYAAGGLDDEGVQDVLERALERWTRNYGTMEANHEARGDRIIDQYSDGARQMYETYLREGTIDYDQVDSVFRNLSTLVGRNVVNREKAQSTLDLLQSIIQDGAQVGMDDTAKIELMVKADETWWRLLGARADRDKFTQTMAGLTATNEAGQLVNIDFQTFNKYYETISFLEQSGEIYDQYAAAMLSADGDEEMLSHIAGSLDSLMGQLEGTVDQVYKNQFATEYLFNTMWELNGKKGTLGTQLFGEDKGLFTTRGGARKNAYDLFIHPRSDITSPAQRTQIYKETYMLDKYLSLNDQGMYDTPQAILGAVGDDPAAQDAIYATQAYADERYWITVNGTGEQVVFMPLGPITTIPFKGQNMEVRHGLPLRVGFGKNEDGSGYDEDALEFQSMDPYYNTQLTGDTPTYISYKDPDTGRIETASVILDNEGPVQMYVIVDAIEGEARLNSDMNELTIQGGGDGAPPPGGFTIRDESQLIWDQWNWEGADPLEAAERTLRNENARQVEELGVGAWEFGIEDFYYDDEFPFVYEPKGFLEQNGWTFPKPAEPVDTYDVLRSTIEMSPDLQAEYKLEGKLVEPTAWINSDEEIVRPPGPSYVIVDDPNYEKIYEPDLVYPPNASLFYDGVNNMAKDVTGTSADQRAWIKDVYYTRINDWALSRAQDGKVIRRRALERQFEDLRQQNPIMYNEIMNQIVSQYTVKE